MKLKQQLAQNTHRKKRKEKRKKKQIQIKRNEKKNSNMAKDNRQRHKIGVI